MTNFKQMLLFSIIFVFLFNMGLDAANEINYYTTITGEINSIGTGEVNKLVLIKDKKIYTLSGNLIKELKQLRNIKVRITGGVASANYPDTDGDIDVIKYNIVKPNNNNNNKNWAFGKIYQSSENNVLIENNQVIYEISNLDILNVKNYKNKKFLLIGSTKFYSDYYAKLKISSFIIIDTN